MPGRIKKGIAVMAIGIGLTVSREYMGEAAIAPKNPEPEAITIEHVISGNEPISDLPNTYFLELPASTTRYELLTTPESDLSDFFTKTNDEFIKNFVQLGFIDTLVGGFVSQEPEYNWNRILEKNGSQIADIRYFHMDKKNQYNHLGELLGIKTGIGGDLEQLPARIEEYKPLFEEAAKKYNTKHKVKMSALELQAIASAESGMDPKTISQTGYFGIMMLGSDLYKGNLWGNGEECAPINPFNADEAIDRGADFYARLLQMFKGNKQLAITAYNQGPGPVFEAIKATGSKNIDAVLNAKKDDGEYVINLEGREYPGRVKMYEKVLKDYQAGKGSLTELIKKHS